MNSVRSTNEMVRPRFGASFVLPRTLPLLSSRIRITACSAPAYASRFGEIFVTRPFATLTSIRNLFLRSSDAAISWLRKSERMRLVVASPTPIAKAQRITNVSPAEMRARRQRIEIRSSTEHVSRAADGVQEPRLATGLELAAEVGDEHLDGVRRGERVVAPDLFEQPLARHHDALVAHQVLEQLELAVGQLDDAVAARDLVR